LEFGNPFLKEKKNLRFSPYDEPRMRSCRCGSGPRRAGLGMDPYCVISSFGTIDVGIVVASEMIPQSFCRLMQEEDIVLI